MGINQGSVIWPLLYLLYTADLQTSTESTATLGTDNDPAIASQKLHKLNSTELILYTSQISQTVIKDSSLSWDRDFFFLILALIIFCNFMYGVKLNTKLLGKIL
jgi:hypothetical protein